METIWGFARPHGVWTVRNGADGKAGTADPATWTTCSLMPSNRENILPSLEGLPQDALYRARSLGGRHHTHWPLQLAPKDAGGGGRGCSRSQNQEWLCPDFAPSAIAGAGLHLPSALLPSAASQPISAPLSRLAAPQSGSAAGPSLCSS